MNQKTKKLIILNLPYAIIGLFCSNIGEAWRIAEGTDISTKLLDFFTSMGTAWGNPMPSFHPFDLCIGLAIGAAFRLVVYVRSKNAKKACSPNSTPSPSRRRWRFATAQKQGRTVRATTTMWKCRTTIISSM